MKVGTNISKTITNICRLILSLTFIISGFVKAVDPLGTQYKINDYLEAMHLTALLPDYLTLSMSVLLSACEYTIGIMLLFAAHRRVVSKLVLLIMVIMTPLTLWLALFNPISNCGCFGDAIELTNWQTFFKNVVLLVAAVIVWRKPDYMHRFVSQSNQWIVLNYTVIFVLFISGYCLYHLPLFDFRPYHIGADIRKGMDIPKGAKKPVFETTFVLEKKGVRKEFSLDNYPDSTWTFIDSKTVEKEKGYVPPIHDFSIQRVSDGEDITQQILDDKGYTFLLISPHLEQADDSNIDLINQIYDYSKYNGYGFFCLTASAQKAINRWNDISGAEYSYCNTDEITLKTIIRSNPGLMLLKDGVVIRKWSHNDLPDEYALHARLEKLDIGKMPTDSVPQKILLIVLWYIMPLALLTFADRIWAWTQWIKKKEEKNKIYQLLKHKNMRKKIVAGNWKMNMNLQDGIALAKELNDALIADKPNCDVVICTPFIHLASVAQFLDQDIIGLGAENCADQAKGAYTGEVSAEMVKSTGAQYVILGHSERRTYYNETPEVLKEKVLLAQANGLKVIFCIGESLEEREANRQNEVVKAELEGSVFNLSEEDFSKIVIAYEPIWAIGTGKTATSEQAEEIHAYIRSCVAEKYGKQVAEETSILYGGSCKASNAPELFGKPDIDGGLIGGAALKVADFKGIIDAWKK
ncbi:MAG: triose-phosphate isomerase [Bacteroidaceae bacterium]|jgi:triosephosphate isomerase|nr:triose-phosphate isomerase [Bacteroidaceae bacterium]